MALWCLCICTEMAQIVLFHEEELPDYEGAFSEIYTVVACTKRDINEKSKKEENKGERNEKMTRSKKR